MKYLSSLLFILILFSSFTQSKKQQIISLTNQLNDLKLNSNSLLDSCNSVLKELTEKNDKISFNNKNLLLKRDSLTEKCQKDSLKLFKRKQFLKNYLRMEEDENRSSCDNYEGVEFSSLRKTGQFEVRFMGILNWQYSFNGLPFNGIAKECLNGRILKQETYKNGYSTGQYKLFYFNGNIKSEITKRFDFNITNEDRLYFWTGQNSKSIRDENKK